ncbi:MAG: sigma-70 family RNA polymerase sigma factor [Chloroflexi bacterium]|nr:sigma-70 family RNA polymerase sigma factor [Chloroflexota bacterium]
MDDETLAQHLAADLDGTFETLVRAYQDRLYAFGLRLTANPRDAEEIAQDALIRAYRALARYPAERIATLHLRAWLFQVAVNVARNRARARRLTEVPLDPIDGPADRLADRLADPDLEHAPADVAERAAARAELAELLGSLPEPERLAVTLRHVHDLSYQDVATILDQPVGTVKSHVHRGVARLRSRLAETDAAAPA